MSQRPEWLVKEHEESHNELHVPSLLYSVQADVSRGHVLFFHWSVSTFTGTARSLRNLKWQWLSTSLVRSFLEILKMSLLLGQDIYGWVKTIWMEMTGCEPTTSTLRTPKSLSSLCLNIRRYPKDVKYFMTDTRRA